MVCRAASTWIWLLAACGPSVATEPDAGDEADDAESGSATGDEGSAPPSVTSGESSASSGASSSSTGGPIPPCGCPVDDEIGRDTFPGCDGIAQPCDVVVLVRCESEGFVEEECVQTGALADPAALQCLLGALRAGTPGRHAISADGFGFFGFRRELVIDEDGTGVALDCEWVDADRGCDTATVGVVDLADGVDACTALSADSSRHQCVWDLFALPDPIAC